MILSKLIGYDLTSEYKSQYKKYICQYTQFSSNYWLNEMVFQGILEQRLARYPTMYKLSLCRHQIMRYLPTRFFSLSILLTGMFTWSRLKVFLSTTEGHLNTAFIPDQCFRLKPMLSKP